MIPKWQKILAALVVPAILLIVVGSFIWVLRRDGITLIAPIFRTEENTVIVSGIWVPDTDYGQLASQPFVFSDIECDLDTTTCLEYRLSVISRKNDERLEEEFEYAIQLSTADEIVAFHQGTTTDRELTISLREKDVRIVEQEHDDSGLLGEPSRAHMTGLIKGATKLMAVE